MDEIPRRRIVSDRSGYDDRHPRIVSSRSGFEVARRCIVSDAAGYEGHLNREDCSTRGDSRAFAGP
jgi:hypothetical protein